MEPNRTESDKQATLTDYLLSRPTPDYIQTGFTREAYFKLVEDEELNRAALISIVTIYENTFAEEDRIEILIGPDSKKTDIPEHNAAWFDRKTLEDLMDGAAKVANFEIDDHNLRSAVALVVAFYNFAYRGWESDVNSMVDMYTVKDAITKEINRLSVETREPETLEQIKTLSEQVSEIRSGLNALEKKAAEKSGHIGLCLQAYHFLITLTV